MPGHIKSNMEALLDNATEHLPPKDKTYLYRLCRPDEDPSKGLEARDTTANGVSISSHIRGKRRSPYISTTATIECVQMFIGNAVMEGFKPGKVVRIDHDKLLKEPGIEIIDLSNQDIIRRSLAKVDAKGRANIAKYKEILLKGKIPPDCIEVLEDIENPEHHETDDYTSSDEEYQDNDGSYMNGSLKQGAFPDTGKAEANGIVNGLNDFENDLEITAPRHVTGETDFIGTRNNAVRNGHSESPTDDDIITKMESENAESKIESPVQSVLVNREVKSQRMTNDLDNENKHTEENDKDDPLQKEKTANQVTNDLIQLFGDEDTRVKAESDGIEICLPFEEGGVLVNGASCEEKSDEIYHKWEAQAKKGEEQEILGVVSRADVNEQCEADDAKSDEGSEIEIVEEEETQEKGDDIPDKALQISSCDDTEKQAAAKKLELLAEKYKISLESFIARRESTIQVLRELVDLLNDCRTRGNITKISGASVSIAGAIAAVASIPLTGGLSAVALTAGSLFSIGGGIAGIGGEVYVNTCEKDYMKRANFVLKCDQEEAERLDHAGFELKSHVSHMTNIGVPEVQIFRIMTTAYTNTMVVFRLLEVSETIAKIGKVTKHAASGLAKAGHLAKGAGAFVSVVFVPLDIWQIVNSSWELTSDNSEKAQMIENVISDLEKDLTEKKIFLNKGVEPNDGKTIASKDEKAFDLQDGKSVTSKVGKAINSKITKRTDLENGKTIDSVVAKAIDTKDEMDIDPKGEMEIDPKGEMDIDPKDEMEIDPKDGKDHGQ